MISLRTSVSIASLEDFFASPSEGFLDVCAREQPLKIAEHYDVEVGDKRLKDRVRVILKVLLLDKVFVVAPPPFSPGAGLVLPAVATGLTFEQQRELLILQLEHERVKVQAALEKELAVEKMRHGAGEVWFD